MARNSQKNFQIMKKTAPPSAAFNSQGTNAALKNVAESCYLDEQLIHLDSQKDLRFSEQQSHLIG